MGEQTFVADVLDASIPVLVHFGAPWCGPCKLVEPVVSRFKDEWHKPLRVVEINADESLLLCSQYRIRTLPTLLFFEGGTLRYRIEGVSHPDDLRTELQRLALDLIYADSRSEECNQV